MKNNEGLINIAVAFAAVAKKNDNILKVLSEEMLSNNIDSPLRICHFLAQMSHESAGFTVLQENLNYSAKGLLQTFGRYFKDGSEVKYARKPQMIANRVYANRMGNGAEDSGDGFKYRGRGFIMITGKENYRVYSQIIFGDNRLLENPDLACDISVAAKIACAFWNKSDLSKHADQDNVDAISDLINRGKITPAKGDAIGYQHRLELTNKAKKAIGI